MARVDSSVVRGHCCFGDKLCWETETTVTLTYPFCSWFSFFGDLNTEGWKQQKVSQLSLTSDYEIRCRPAHGFHHVLSMTGNMSEFTRVIKRQRISGNMDTPEGGLDAMLQAAVCQVWTYRCWDIRFPNAAYLFSKFTEKLKHNIFFPFT